MLTEHLNDVLCYRRRNCGDNRIPKLAISLRVRHYNRYVALKTKERRHIGIESHYARSFAGSEPPWTLALLRNQNLRTILVIARAQCTRNAIKVSETESESVSFFRMALCVIL